jgi:hypothetical protein
MGSPKARPPCATRSRPGRWAAGPPCAPATACARFVSRLAYGVTRGPYPIAHLPPPSRQPTPGPTPVASRRLAAGQSAPRRFSLPGDGHFVWPLAGPPRSAGRLTTVVYALWPDTVEGRKTSTHRLGDGVVGRAPAFWPRIRLQYKAAMEQCAGGPLARRPHCPPHTAFLIREGDTTCGHGGAPSPQTTIRGEKENRPRSTCQSKIAKLLVRPLVEAAAAKYAQGKGITPRTCP